MVWYDFAILGLLVYTMWSGAQRGFVTQLAWIFALVLCFKFSDELAPVIEPQINVEQPLRHWIAMLILYLAFSLGSFMLARILTSWLEKTKLKDFDRHLGGLLGLVKGGIIAMVITFFAVTLSESLQATVMKSYTGPAVCKILDGVEPITPHYFKEYFQEYLDRYREGLGDVHDGHLGESGSLDEIFGSDDGSAVPRPPADDGGFVRDIFDGLVNSSNKPADSLSANDSGSSRESSFRDLLGAIPGQLTSATQQQLQDRWQQSSPAERQNLLDQMGNSFGNQVPDVLRNFIGRTGQGGASSNSGTVDAGQMLNTLNAIGDIYQDRDYIVNQALSRLDGVPLEIQKAVIDDWYADWSFQRVDPDPATARNTGLDERILSQLQIQGGWDKLSLDLKRRLANARQ